jgi:hypothetical protein
MDKNIVEKVIRDHVDLIEWIKPLALTWHDAYCGDSYGSVSINYVCDTEVSFRFIPSTSGMNLSYTFPFDLLFDEKALLINARKRKATRLKKFEEEREERELYKKLKYKFEPSPYLTDGNFGQS